MYCIVDIVYGVPLNQKVYDAIEKLGLTVEEVDGCTELYSGGGVDESPGYCGVKLGEFDEATDMAIKVSTLNLKPTPAQMEEAEQKITNLHPDIKKHIKIKPDVFFVFSTS